MRMEQNSANGVVYLIKIIPDSDDLEAQREIVGIFGGCFEPELDWVSV